MTMNSSLPSEKLCGVVCALATQYKFPAHQRATVDLQRNLDALNAEVNNWAQKMDESSAKLNELVDQLYNVGHERLVQKEIGFNGKARFYLSSWAPDFKLLLSKVISSCLFQLNQLKLKRQEAEKVAEVAEVEAIETGQLDKVDSGNNNGVYYSATGINFTQPVCKGVGIWNLVKEAQAAEDEAGSTHTDAIDSIATEKVEAGRNECGNDWEEF